jgi:transposase
VGADRAATACPAASMAPVPWPSAGGRPARSGRRGLRAEDRTGITWNQVPAAVIGCSGVTCWRRVRDWTEAGVWPALQELLLAELRAAGLLDLDRMAVDASHVHALKGGITSGLRRSIVATPAPSTT